MGASELRALNTGCLNLRTQPASRPGSPRGSFGATCMGSAGKRAAAPGAQRLRGTTASSSTVVTLQQVLARTPGSRTPLPSGTRAWSGAAPRPSRPGCRQPPWAGEGGSVPLWRLVCTTGESLARRGELGELGRVGCVCQAVLAEPPRPPNGHQRRGERRAGRECCSRRAESRGRRLAL